MDISTFLLDELSRNHPALVPAIVAAVPAVKFLVDLFKRFVPTAQGNIIQTVAGVISVGASGFIGYNMRLYADGVSRAEVYGLVLLAALIWLGSIGFNEATKDRNEPRPA